MDDRIGLGIMLFFAATALAVFGCYSAGIIHGDGDTYSHIIVHVDGGVDGVEGAGYSRDGDTVTLTASLKTDYHLLGWYDGDGNKLSSNNPYTFVSADDVQVYTVTEYGKSAKAYHTDGITEVYTVGNKMKVVMEDGYTFAGWYNVADGKLVNQSGIADGEFTFDGVYDLTVNTTQQYMYVAKTTSTKYQGTSELHMEREGANANTLIWVVVDSETEDYVTSTSETAELSVLVAPGQYTVIIYGWEQSAKPINDERHPCTVS